MLPDPKAKGWEFTDLSELETRRRPRAPAHPGLAAPPRIACDGRSGERPQVDRTGAPCAEVEVVDDRDGRSPPSHRRRAAVPGLGTIDQHRLVKAAVQERMDDGSIHALSLNTAPAEPSEPVTSEIESEG